MTQAIPIVTDTPETPTDPFADDADFWAIVDPKPEPKRHVSTRATRKAARKKVKASNKARNAATREAAKALKALEKARETAPVEELRPRPGWEKVDDPRMNAFMSLGLAGMTGCVLFSLGWAVVDRFVGGGIFG
ncbi:hypothetical protein [Longispora urticae]